MTPLRASYIHISSRVAAAIRLPSGEYAISVIGAFPMRILARSGNPHRVESWAKLLRRNTAETDNRQNVKIQRGSHRMTAPFWQP